MKLPALTLTALLACGCADTGDSRASPEYPGQPEVPAGGTGPEDPEEPREHDPLPPVSTSDAEAEAMATTCRLLAEGELMPGDIELLPVATQRAAPGDAVSLTLEVATDATAPVEFLAQGLPPGLVIDRATGVISGRVASQAEGSYEVLVMARQGDDRICGTFGWRIDR